MKERNKTPKDTNGIRIGVVIFTVALIASLLVVAYILQKNPNTDFITTISGIGTFATALLTTTAMAPDTAVLEEAPAANAVMEI